MRGDNASTRVSDYVCLRTIHIAAGVSLADGSSSV
jgi:hypothetical protein